jgi:hypothetical protein
MTRSSPRLSMGCSFCAPQSRADDAMVGQELDQLMGTVLERSTKAVVAMKFLAFVQHSTRYMALLAPPRRPLRFSGGHAGDRTPSGSGSCQRGRDRGIHRSRSFRPCSELHGLSWRLQMQNLAHFDILISRNLPKSRRTSRNRRYAPAGHLLRGVWPSTMYNDHAL